MGPLAQDIGFEPMTYTLEECCCYPTELILHMLYGCFAVSKHYHRTRVDFETCAPPYTTALLLTELVLHTSLELVAYGFEVRHSIQLS